MSGSPAPHAQLDALVEDIPGRRAKERADTPAAGASAKLSSPGAQRRVVQLHDLTADPRAPGFTVTDG